MRYVDTFFLLCLAFHEGIPLFLLKSRKIPIWLKKIWHWASLSYESSDKGLFLLHVSWIELSVSYPVFIIIIPVHPTAGYRPHLRDTTEVGLLFFASSH